MDGRKRGVGERVCQEERQVLKDKREDTKIQMGCK